MAKKPNFIVIMTDDQGYGDLSCMGSKDFVTPHIDGLAASGARFTDWYSGSPVCSPSRACLLTGRYPGNAGVRAILAGHRKASGLTPKVPTIAAALKGQGYKTSLVGKWHLGLKDECRPNQNGFDDFYGFMAGAWIITPTFSTGAWRTATPTPPTTCGKTKKRCGRTAAT